LRCVSRGFFVLVQCRHAGHLAPDKNFAGVNVWYTGSIVGTHVSVLSLVEKGSSNYANNSYRTRFDLCLLLDNHHTACSNFNLKYLVLSTSYPATPR
jgi:hypothetical protein